MMWFDSDKSIAIAMLKAGAMLFEQVSVLVRHGPKYAVALAGYLLKERARKSKRSKKRK